MDGVSGCEGGVETSAGVGDGVGEEWDCEIVGGGIGAGGKGRGGEGTWAVEGDAVGRGEDSGRGVEVG